MKTMSAGKFKANCLKIMDAGQITRGPVVITKNGRPVANLVAVEKQAPDLVGCLAGVVEIVGDIQSQVLPPEVWKALR